MKKILDEIRAELNEFSSLNTTPILIAVTKTKSIETINEAIKLGVTEIGENKVQEIIEKFPNLEGNFNIHMIGHLQTNKVKYIVGLVSLIHSVDSIKLANEIDKHAQKKDIIQDVLVQVNIAGEVQKGGVLEKDFDELITHISGLKNIRLRGLMNIAVDTDDDKSLRADFRKMKQLFDKLQDRYDNIDYLSMGMSHDYKIALEEGSNMVRIGSKIFGERI